MIRRIALTITCVLVASALTACTGAGPSSLPNDESTHKHFGAPAIAAPPGFTYQPDVKVVGGGRNSVVDGSADGREWTLDATAPGMDDVRIGDVIFATNYVVGRVLELRRSGRSLVVTLFPVPITDVIREGTIEIDSDIAASDLVLQPNASLTDDTVVSGDDVTVDPATMVSGPSRAPTSRWSDWAPGYGQGQDFSVGGFDASATYAPDGLNLSIARSSGGIKMGVDFGLRWDSLKFRSSTAIRDGKVVSSSSSILGLKSVTATLTGGAASPAASIPRFRAEVPFTAQIPLGPGVPPWVVQFKISFLIGAAFGGANATISAHGEWALNGGLNASNGTPAKPGFKVKKSLIDSISGLSLGPTAVVFGLSLRILGGFGVPGFAIGPYGKLTASVGIANGSALGAPLVRCRSASLELNAAFGVGFDLTSEFPKIADSPRAKPYVERIKAAASAWHEVSQSIASREQTIPDVPLCKS